MGSFPSNSGAQKQQRLADRANTIFYWEKFEKLFPTEETCIDSIFAAYAADKLIVCHWCNSTHTEKLDLRTFKCLSCKKKSFFTKGSFFQHVRRIKAMVGAMWLLENGVRFSACHFAELAGIAKSTATCMVKKIAMLILRTMDDARETINSIEFMEIFIRRSFCTPALEHPRMEQEIAEQQYLANSPEKQLAAHEKLIANLSSVEKSIYDLLDFTPTHCETIQDRLNIATATSAYALIRLELSGLITSPGACMYSRPRHRVFVPNDTGLDECPPEQKVDAHSVVAFIKASMHGIARRYLQLYVSIFSLSHRPHQVG